MEVKNVFLQTSDKLESMITVYKSQLKQIESVLPGATDEQRIELETLVKTMNELIGDARNNQSEAEHWFGHLNEAHPIESNANFPPAPENPTFNHTETVSKISEQWEGKQCQAPFQQLSGLIGYHNAIVIQIEPDPSPQNEILVQVAYSNPICPKMRPCPFYLEGKCRFSDIKCRYSHGQLVKLNSLKEYKEPDFNLVQPGVRVLAKSFQDELWHPGFVSSKLANQTFKIILDNSEIPLEVSLQFILPFDNKEEEKSSLGTDDEEDKEAESVPDYEFGTPNRLGWAYSQLLDHQTLGEWEKHTKGIGSKLMAKMGYETGQGLGKECQGRLNPVDAMVLPSGRSLDHCMELKEQAMDEDLLRVEKRLARAKAKEERRLQQLTERSDEKPALTSIFDFMNATLGTAKTETEANPIPSTSKTKSIKKVSTQKLNLQGFQLAESIRKAEKDLAHYRSSLQRQQLRGDARLVQQTRQKIASKEHEVEKLKASEISVAKEQNLRKSSSKLSIF